MEDNRLVEELRVDKIMIMRDIENDNKTERKHETSRGGNGCINTAWK